MQQRTIGRLWRDAVAAGRPDPVHLAERRGAWEPVSLGDAARQVDDLAHGLLALGIRKGNVFGILATTRSEWSLFDFALALTGAVSAPVYATSSPQDTAYVLGHSEAVGVLVEDDEARRAVESVRGQLPLLRHVLTIADLERLAADGRAFAEQDTAALAQAEQAVTEDDLFTVIYTSGTTGPPKGCMIRHRNYYEMAATIDRLDGLVGVGDTMLLYLPLAHNFGRLMHLAGPYAGYTVAFCADPYAVADALLAVRPTIFPSVPRIYEKIHAAVIARFDATHGPRKALLRWALHVGRRVSGLRQEHRAVPALLRLQHRLADRLVYAQVKERLGGRIRVALSGGAPLALEILRFFHALDILILEGYGLTECTTAASVNRPTRYRFGTVGPPFDGVELRLGDDGELFLRSPTIFAGYLKEEKATEAVLDGDGWLATGDVASIDEDGFITITDRKKDILVTAGGKNVAPQNLENELKASKVISQALVVGDRRPYVAALITLDAAEITAWAKAHGLSGDVPALAAHPDVHALVQDVVDDVNALHSRFEQIKRFAILPRDFSEEEGEVTPTLKLRRKICFDNFEREIEALYLEPHDTAGAGDAAARGRRR